MTNTNDTVKKYQLRKLLLPAGIILLAAGMLAVLFFGPSSRFRMERHLKELYGEEFFILFSEKVPGDEIEGPAWSACAFTATPRSDPDFRFYAFSILATDGFWPVPSRYFTDNYEEHRMLRIWEEEAASAGVQYQITYDRYPYRSTEEAYYSGICVHISLTPENTDEICELMSKSMERMLAETSAENGRMTCFDFFLRYREEDWPADEECAVTIMLFNNLYHGENGSEWREVDTDAAAIREYILKEAQDYEERIMEEES